MFTGIIQNRARVESKAKQDGQIRFTFKFFRKEKKIHRGESIAVNGVCLTVSKVKTNAFQADVIRATLAQTNLDQLRVGDPVNIERSLKFGDSVSGHFMTGHIDAESFIQKIERQGKNRLWTISMPPSIQPYIAVKGSVALDGVSLTIQSVNARSFTVALVPHTLQTTTFRLKRAGARLNLEMDLIARYLTHQKTQLKKNVLPEISDPTKQRSKWWIQKLKQQGF